MSEQNEFMQEEQLIEIIENQLEDGQPVKVKETLMRLMMTGTPREEAIAAMACALAIEVFDVMKTVLSLIKNVTPSIWACCLI